MTPARGLNFGAAQQTNGVYVLGFLARFLEDSGSGNVLSTPNLLTLDNEEAKIVIGQNVPFRLASSPTPAPVPARSARSQLLRERTSA